MNSIIIYKSEHHLNTEKVARAMAEGLGSDLAKPEEVDITSLEDYELIGVGSGIYHSTHHTALLKFARMLPSQKKEAFIFSTCGKWMKNYHSALREILTQKDFIIKGEFTCNGWDTYGPLRLIGGIRKGHPDAKDLEDARVFAKSLLS